MKLVFSLLLLFTIASNRSAYAEEWRILAPDLQLLQREAISEGFFSQQLTYFRTSLRNYQVKTIRAVDYGSRRLSVANLCRQSKALLCINANFFDEKGSALGLVTQRGRQLQSLHRGGSTLTGLFAVTRDRVIIYGRAQATPPAVLESIQAGPRLLVGGAPVNGLLSSPRTRRSGVCIDKNRRLLFFITSSSFGGLTFKELQSELLRPEIACIDALNLDGGGSSQLFLNTEQLSLPDNANPVHVPGLDEVPVALGLFQIGQRE